MRGGRRTTRWKPRLAEPAEGLARNLGEGWQASSSSGVERQPSPVRASPQAVGDPSTDAELISALEKASCFSLCKDSWGNPSERQFGYRGATVVLQNTFVEFRGPPAHGCHHRSQSADVRNDGQEEALAFSRYLHTFHRNWTSHSSKSLSHLLALGWCPSLVQQPGKCPGSLASSRQGSARDRTCSRGSARGSPTSPEVPELEGGVLLPTPSATPPQSVPSTPRQESRTGATPRCAALQRAEGDNTTYAGATNEAFVVRPREPLPRPQRVTSAWRPTLRHLCPEASEVTQSTSSMQRGGIAQRNSSRDGLVPR